MHSAPQRVRLQAQQVTWGACQRWKVFLPAAPDVFARQGPRTTVGAGSEVQSEKGEQGLSVPGPVRLLA
eukprot:1160247-Pelagomonas_calceolata.AAC.11